MKRKPRNLFTTRMRGKTLYCGPAFVGDPQPNYLGLLDQLARRHAGQLGPGLHTVEVRHDDDCAHWSQGPCDCEPEVRLVEGLPAAE